jgi:Zn-dependent protease with chaperone function
LVFGNATPPYIIPANFETDILPNLAPNDTGEHTWAYTPRGQDNIMRIPEDVIDSVSSCQLASLILHEMIHIVNNDPKTGQDTERPNAFNTCTAQCVNPTFQ